MSQILLTKIVFPGGCGVRREKAYGVALLRASRLPMLTKKINNLSKVHVPIHGQTGKVHKKPEHVHNRVEMLIMVANSPPSKQHREIKYKGNKGPTNAKIE